MNKLFKVNFLLIGCMLVFNTASIFSQNISDTLVQKNIKVITEAIEKSISNGQVSKNVLIILGQDCFTFDEFKAQKQNIPALGSAKILQISMVKREAADHLPVCNGKSTREGICFVSFCTNKTRECLSEADMQKIQSENKRNRVILNDSANYPIVTLTDKYNAMNSNVDHSLLTISLKPTSGLIIDVNQITKIANIYKKMDVYKLSVRVGRYEADVFANVGNQIVVHSWQLIDKSTGKEFYGFTDRAQPVFLDVINTETRTMQDMYMFVFNVKE